MSDDDFVDALRRTDDRWRSERPSDHLDARVVASLHGRGRSIPALGMIAAAGAIAGALVFMTRDRPAVDPPAPLADLELADFEPARCAPAAESSALRLDKGCTVTLRAPAMAIHALETVELLRGAAGIEVIRGVARFDVERVKPGASRVVVLVADGRIEVVGTRFVVTQRHGVGTVFLEVGRIDFIARSGERQRLEPGGSRTWGPSVSAAVVLAQPPVDAGVPRARAVPPDEGGPIGVATRPEAPPVADRPVEIVPAREPKRAPSELTPEALLESAPPRTWSVEQTSRAVQWVSKLRGEGRYAEAVVWIARLLEAPLDARAAEVLSFERGQLLERKLGDTEGACQHWGAHRARFPGGRYEIEVTTALNRCGAVNSPRGRE